MVDSTTFVPVRKLISDPGVVPASPFICTDASRNYNRLSAYWLQPRTLGPMQIGLHGLGGLAACCAACAAGRACTGCLNGITTGRYITTGVFSPGVSGIQEIATSIQDKTDGYGVPVLIGASIGYLAKKKSGAVAGALAGAGLTWAFGRYVQPIVASVFGAGSLGGFRDDFRLNPAMTDADTPLDRSAFRFLQLILIVGASTLAFKVLKKRNPNGRRRNARQKAERAYHYRGLVERGRRWASGYSAQGPGGGVLYPWMTKSEARTNALRDGFKAVFYRDGKKE